MFEREENPSNVKSAKIVVGLASYKEADNIAFPTEQVSLGLRKYFPEYDSVIVNCDNRSPDGTQQAFLETATEVPNWSPYSRSEERRSTVWMNGSMVTGYEAPRSSTSIRIPSLVAHISAGRSNPPASQAIRPP